MRISLQWLDEIVPVADLDPSDLAARLTGLGLEVDDIWMPGRDIAGVVAARVLEVRSHPDAGTLSLCTVTDGKGRHRVVCGAPNVRTGMVVPWAPPGTRLPGGTVERRNIRGQESAGMLCSASELGWDHVSDLEEGLWELPADAIEGTAAAFVVGLDDAVFTIDLTPNYASHCQSILGVARELSAALGRPLRAADPAALPVAGGPIDGLVKVSIADPDLCPRYTAIVIDGVSMGPSPWSIQRRLLLSGVRPHSNIVDITNYVMLERGQPLHAFDLAALDGPEVVVRRARPGETITTLDGRERKLSGSDLVIADLSRPVAVAGVMGGLDTEVGDLTRTILLESASFDPPAVRRTASRMGLRTDASARFEKGLDVLGTLPAAERAAAMLCGVAGGRAAPGVVDVFPATYVPRTAGLRPAAANSLLGLTVDEGEMVDILRRLGCDVDKGEHSYTVTIPSWRVDLELEVDLIEEIARHHGYDHIPSTVPTGPVAPPAVEPTRRLSGLFRSALLGAGLDEAVTYSFTSTEILGKMNLPAGHPWLRLVPIMNPQGRWQEGLRATLVPGLLASLAANHQNGQRDTCAFEISKVYVADQLPLQSLPREPWRLAIAGSGRHLPVHWAAEDRDIDFFDLKGVIEMLLARFGPRDATWERTERPWLHPGRAAEVRAGETVLGWTGELNPEVARAFDITGRAVVAQMDLDAWWGLAAAVPQFSDWGRYPAATRDLAFVVAEEVEASRVQKCLEEAGSPLLEEAVLFDVYRGPQVGDGKKSLAYSLTYRAPDRTLTDAEVEGLQQEVRKALGEQLGAVLRT